MANLQAIKDEIETNPAGMAYPAFVDGNDVAIADVMNAPTRTLNKQEISTSDFVGETTFAAYDGLTASESAYYDMIVGRETIAVTADTLAGFAAIGGTSIWQVGDKPTMEPRIVALMQFLGARALEISLTLGTAVVTPSQVRDARLLP